ncbi:hypothetical protein [Streptomyces sp. NRRL F-4474]|uniref:hypothetical protein n=1 Tax=Streptomyces sp. NRRL F-4474 TaxID=1463851 RepID=UPI0004CC64C8|nr:hypothetical protein [Streptomyces sp. NRRL F-4474]
MIEQPVAQGLGYAHEQYGELWAQITRRDPKVLTAHTSALQYWCAKWRGSHELALAFARESAASGKPGELLSLLPLTAYFEQKVSETSTATSGRCPGPTRRGPRTCTRGTGRCAR